MSVGEVEPCLCEDTSIVHVLAYSNAERGLMSKRSLSKAYKGSFASFQVKPLNLKWLKKG